MIKRAIVIGAGFSGLAAAASLAKKGFQVKVLEKHNMAGGRARKFETNGFMFDMGPSWYWMPDVFDKFFESFGRKTSDYYDLKRLDPSYRVFWSENDHTDLPVEEDQMKDLFESIESGAGENLDAFMQDAKFKYDIGMSDLVYRPSYSALEFAELKIAANALKLQIFRSFDKHIKKYFKSRKLLQLMEFPILFLGGTAKNTPALYSLMNYADAKLGTWYPMGGMYKIIEGMQKLAEEQGVEFLFNQDVQNIEIQGGLVHHVKTQDSIYDADFVVSGADYHHTEDQLLDADSRNYNEKYWENKQMSPSSLIFYLGVNKRLSNLQHHNLFFDEDFATHAHQIYKNPQWPDKPSFYICAPSKTDPAVAPRDHENLFVLMPVAAGLEDKDETREKYFELFLERFEKLTGQSIRANIIYKRSYAHRDFQNDYNAYKGNAYGLANTLMQTAFMKPGLKNKKVKNLFYTGQLTVPGPGVPPAIISGQIVASEIAKQAGMLNKTKEAL
ncbi:MAG: phytoene desaturase family protein [Bacteroidota bacterium]|nr:phytoene desaturase family protein [Bacteroidota bacterium]